MRPNCWKRLALLLLPAALPASPAFAQDIRIEVGKRASVLPEECRSVSPAAVGERVDVGALVREAICRGSGDSLSEYTYVVESAKRVKLKNGRSKVWTKVYEVYLPTLRSGSSAPGVLLLTHVQGVPLAPRELTRGRALAGARLARHENEIARQPAARPEGGADIATGLPPLGVYPRLRAHPELPGRPGGATLDVRTILKTCELTPLGRRQDDGREALVFSFAPRRDAQFDADQKYIARLGGTVWIDAQDRIVTRLVGWPVGPSAGARANQAPTAGEEPPAVYVEMLRTPEGVWLPRAVRLNGADYPALFDHVHYDSTITYGGHRRFKIEVDDVRMNAPARPR